MAIEQFVNDPSQTYGTLAANIGATDTSLTMNGGNVGPYPQTGSGTSQFRILIDTEIIIVGAGQGSNTWSSLQRGVDGSVAASHASGATVIPVVTGGALTNLAEQGFSYLKVKGVGSFGPSGRFIGSMSTSGVAPTGGPYLTGDWGVDLADLVWTCTSGGSPGTWISGAAIQTYTPTWTGSVTNPTIGNGVLTGTYQLSGKKCFITIECQFNTTTTGGKGSYAFSLPPGVAAAAGIEQELMAKAYTYGGTFCGVGIIGSGGGVIVPWFPLSPSNTALGAAQNTDSTGNAGTGVPLISGQLTWQANATGYNIIICGSFLTT